MLLCLSFKCHFKNPFRKTFSGKDVAGTYLALSCKGNKSKLSTRLPAPNGVAMQQICTIMAVKKGDTVQVHYTGKTTDGNVFDSSEGRAPLQFEVGAGQMIPGFDKGVEGMELNEKKTIHIPALEGYGEWNEQNVVAFPKEQVPPDMKLEVGMKLQLMSDSGMPIEVSVVEILPDSILLDANHFLAGEDLVFDVELVDVQPKSLIITP